MAPRVRVSRDGAATKLQERIRQLIEARRVGAVQICGLAGTGKSTALAHLAAVLPLDVNVQLLDRARVDEIREAAERSLVVYAGLQAPGNIAELEMAPWGNEDFIEYLLAVHRPRCKAVMARVLSSTDRAVLGGTPELWRRVLDQMAADDFIGPVEALRWVIAAELADPNRRAAAGRFALRLTASGAPSTAGDYEVAVERSALARLIMHEPVRVFLAADALMTELIGGGGAEVLSSRLPRELIHEIGRQARASVDARGRLESLLLSKARDAQPMAASILIAAEPGWRPMRVPFLVGADLSGARWPAQNLSGARLYEANFTRADLRSAILDRATAERATFRQADLREASMACIAAPAADFTAADLRGAGAAGANLRGADFTSADLRGASLTSAELREAKFTRARLEGADLSRAVLEWVTIDGADFTGANLRGAMMCRLCLRDATFTHASFCEASLQHCDLEGIELPGADFSRAKLAGCLLTSSIMPGANFGDADLRNCGLAEVEWQDADLRGADLRGSSFHLGSTRSGLVGSDTPCEGSRTGFYTDDFNDQDFQPPEAIRKANLCGADLRGAKIDGVDFYLVDLRGARYTPAQGEHLTRCGAILRTRV